MTIGVYGIFDSRNDECLYVGHSSTIEQRWRQHVSSLKNKRKKALKEFVDWYHENGADESLFRFEILEICENTDFAKNYFEAKYYDELNPRFAGKIPSLSEKWSHSEAAKKAISDGLKNFHSINKTPYPLCSQCGEETSRRSRKFCSSHCRNIASKVEIDIDLLEKMYLDESIDFNEICDHFQVTGGVLLNRLKSRGIESKLSQKVRQKDLIDILTKEKLVELFVNQNFVQWEIAEMYNTSSGVISSLLRKHEIPKRSTSEAAKASWEARNRKKLAESS